MAGKIWSPKDFLKYFPGGLALVSMDGSETLLYVNKKLAILAGFSSVEEFQSSGIRTLKDLVFADDYTPLLRLYERGGSDRAEGVSIYFRLPDRGQGVMPLTGTIRVYREAEDHPCWCLTLHKNRPTGESSPIDAMTGVLSPKGFFERATAIHDMDVAGGLYGSRIPMFVNLTNFKLYNMQHGMKGGNKLIRKMAECLRHYFPTALIGHQAGDRFTLLAPRMDPVPLIESLKKDLEDYIGDSSIRLKVGIFRYDFRPGHPLDEKVINTFDMAKLAADSIRRDGSRTWAYYEESMGDDLEDRAYVLKHFEEALQKKYIKVYFQPVIRTLTGKLCSMEALSRWEDPEKGLLSPGLFIPVLEEYKLIPLLDCYMIEEVARHFCSLRESHRTIVPVSVNFSRIDFDRMDPVKFLESIVRKYKLERRWFCVEITESAQAIDGEHLKKEVDRFREAGYECWLDDFGSGYSSFNALQNCHFDEIKIDMAFQRSSGEESSKILSSIVLMAKSLGIHTLAEGVETKAQAQFLRSIGCEKIQGYYYGRPMPYDNLVNHCMAHDIIPESATEAAVFEKAGHINVITDTPTAIFMYDGNETTLLLMNEAFRKVVLPLWGDFARGKTMVFTKSILDHSQNYVHLLQKAIASRKMETLTFVENEQYLRCNLEVSASLSGLTVGREEMYNITFDGETKAIHRLDRISRTLLTFYEGIYYYDLQKDRMEILASVLPDQKPGDILTFEEARSMADVLHPDDRERFLAFMNRDKLDEAMSSDLIPMISTVFRARQKDGSYRWKENTIIILKQENHPAFLYIIKDAALEAAEDKASILGTVLRSMNISENEKSLLSGDSQAILDALRQVRGVNMFWKDRKRRFLGASRGLLEYYGMKDESEMIGKTDEDMGWHVSNTNYPDLEEKIFHSGVPSENAPGRCIIRGKIHRIRAFKYPVYKNNQIIGLLGYFTDEDSSGAMKESDETLGLIHRETGLLSYRGMIMTALNYDQYYHRTGRDYLAILLHIPGLDEMGKKYGEEAFNSLARVYTDMIAEFFYPHSTLAYLGGSRYMIFMEHRSEEEARGMMKNLTRKIYSIRENEGLPVTPYLHYVLAQGSETRNIDELLSLLNERMAEMENDFYADSIFVGKRIAFDLEDFETLEHAVFISDLDSREILYVNPAMREVLHYPEDKPLSGETVETLLKGRYQQPAYITLNLKRGQLLPQTFRDPETGETWKIYHTLIPWRGRNCHFAMGVRMQGNT